MSEQDWVWHTVRGADPKDDLLILTDDFSAGRVRLEIRQEGARSLTQDEVEALFEEQLLRLQEALRSPSRLRKRAPSS